PTKLRVPAGDVSLHSREPFRIRRDPHDGGLMPIQSRNLTAARPGSPARSMVASVAIASALLPGPFLSYPQTCAAEQNPQVRVTTNMGDFVIELLPDRAPLTVANFLRYVREGYYSGTLIHRVVANFVIQGGGHDAADYKL